MKVQTNNSTGKIVFTFDGETADATFDVHQASFDLCIHAMMFGFTNRLKDTAAIARKQSDGSIIDVTEDMRRAKVVEMIDHITSGTDQWNMKATARAPKQNAAIMALATALGKTYEEAEAHIANMALEELSD